jgi:hypothetical protein
MLVYLIAMEDSKNRPSINQPMVVASWATLIFADAFFLVGLMGGIVYLFRNANFGKWLAENLVGYIVGIIMFGLFFGAIGITFTSFLSVEQNARILLRSMAPIFFMFSFIFSRFLVGFAKSWTDLKPYHWLMMPPLMFGYGAILLLVVTWPLWILVIIASAPNFIAIDPTTWTLFGEHYIPSQYPIPSQFALNRYWLLAIGWGAGASILWSLGFLAETRRQLNKLSGVAMVSSSVTQTWIRDLPQLPSIFHPARPEAIRTSLTYFFVVVEIALVLTSAASLFIAHNMK